MEYLSCFQRGLQQQFGNSCRKVVILAKITAYNIVHAIGGLRRNVDYNYINPRTHGLIRIIDVHMPAGPIVIRRWNPSKGESSLTARDESISSEMIWRVANAISKGDPVNFDRVLGGSYNTRSVLETLMALTPEFYYCYPFWKNLKCRIWLCLKFHFNP